MFWRTLSAHGLRPEEVVELPGDVRRVLIGSDGCDAEGVVKVAALEKRLAGSVCEHGRSPELRPAAKNPADQRGRAGLTQLLRPQPLLLSGHRAAVADQQGIFLGDHRLIGQHFQRRTGDLAACAGANGAEATLTVTPEACFLRRSLLTRRDGVTLRDLRLESVLAETRKTAYDGPDRP